MPGDQNERTTRSDAKLAGIENALKEIKEQLEALTMKVNKVDEKVNTQGKLLAKIEEIRQSNKAIEEGIKEVKAENMQMKIRIAKIERRVETQEMKERRNQLELVGIPVTSNEKPEELMMKLAKETKVEVKNTDIESCYRIKAREGREGPIIIKFKEARERDRVMKELKSKKPTLEMISYEPKQKKIFVNESLTPTMKEVLYKVKTAAREKGWNRVWTYAGTVYVKTERESRQIKIETKEEMDILLQ